MSTAEQENVTNQSPLGPLNAAECECPQPGDVPLGTAQPVGSFGLELQQGNYSTSLAAALRMMRATFSMVWFASPQSPDSMVSRMAGKNASS